MLWFVSEANDGGAEKSGGELFDRHDRTTY